MKQNLLITASLLVLASCASKTQNVDLTEDNLNISKSVHSDSDYSNMSGDVDVFGIDTPSLTEETIQLRNELNQITTNTVRFNFDSSALTLETQEVLDTIANFVLTKDAISLIVIQGHTDERGTRDYNLALGERRAVAVKKYLVGLGINSAMIETSSFGKEMPEDPSHSPEAWAKNRRAVILVEAQ